MMLFSTSDEDTYLMTLLRKKEDYYISWHVEQNELLTYSRVCHLFYRITIIRKNCKEMGH